jgi:hypothetical protein
VRVWDVPAGYLNRQSLLAEHREIHGLLSIIVHGKRGYSRHPETLRWAGCLSGLARRHAWVVAEMRLRGYSDRSPVDEPRGPLLWPAGFVTSAAGQYQLLRAKYRGKAPGRIPLPGGVQQLWAHHKYSVMARDPAAYRTLGRRVARMRRDAEIAPLTDELVSVLRRDPLRGRLVNALEHMWGHVRRGATPAERLAAEASPAALLLKTQQLAIRAHERYLLASTSLSELEVFVAAG